MVLKAACFGPFGKAEQNEVLQPNGLQYEPEGWKSATPRRSGWFSVKTCLWTDAEGESLKHTQFGAHAPTVKLAPSNSGMWLPP